MFDHVGAYPGRHENVSPLWRKVIQYWRHWEDNPDRTLGFWHWKTISDQRTGVPTYSVKQQFNPARLTSLQLSSPAKQNTIGIHNTTAFSWQPFITLQSSGRLSMKKDILNTQRNLGVPRQGLTLHLTVAAPKGSSSAKVTQYTQHARERAISPCSTPPLSR